MLRGIIVWSPAAVEGFGRMGGFRILRKGGKRTFSVQTVTVRGVKSSATYTQPKSQSVFSSQLMYSSLVGSMEACVVL